MNKFKEIGLSQNLVRVLEEIKFEEPTEIQEKVIPLALAGKDVIGESATGSGKTLAFGAPIIENIERGKFLQALILTPTRELAEQVSKSLMAFSKYSSLKVVSVYGGVSLNPQIDDLRRAEIAVGTPGRILDHIARRTINLSKVRFLVLDEADRMFDMGFFEDVTKIIGHCSRERQTFLFSATISQEILEISKRYMHNAVEVSVEHYVDSSKLEQSYYEVSSREKFSLLVHLLKKEESKLVLVFCNTKRNADIIGKNLKRYGLDSSVLHGGLAQNKRTRVLESFHKSDKLILVCTDVAARGLDIKNLSHVYNYDSPKTSTEYIHRAGRTARAGKEGKVITILSEKDYENFRNVLRDDSLKIEKIPVPEFEKVFVKMNDDGHRGSFGGSRERGRGGFSRGGSGFGRREGGFSRGGGSFRSREGGFRSRGGGGGFRTTGKRFGQREDRGDRFSERRGGFGRRDDRRGGTLRFHGRR